MIRVEPTAKRIRTYLDGELVADTVNARLVWEHRPYPAYWLPQRDVRMDLVAAHAHTSTDEELRGLVRIDWDAMDAWFEEDEPVIVHPRSPYARVDILASSRHVEVSLDGVVLADTVRPRLLFETGLPVRYYIPLLDVAMDRLRPSPTVTRCPYKGTATYWSVEVNGRLEPDLVWTYAAPLLESVKVAGLACFWSERVDLTVDGVVQERPASPWANAPKPGD